MTPEAQRIAIAEACGWSDCKRATSIARTIGTTVVGTNDRLQQSNRVWKYDSVPDYLNDLNAMHEAEKILTIDQQHKYYTRVYELAEMSELYTQFGLIHAMADQRAEAFLRTLGLWKE